MTREEAFRAAFRGVGRFHQALQQERAFAALHPDYYAVLERGGIWRAMVVNPSTGTYVEPTTVRVIQEAPNPAEAAYGLALTRIGTGETE